MKKVIVGIMGVGVGVVAGSFCVLRKKKKSDARLSGKIEKFKGYYYLLNQWLVLKQEGKSLEQYFVDNGYKTLAIYGMGELGNRLYEELKNSKRVKTEYVIDQNTTTYSEVRMFDMEGTLPDVDVVIVTAIFAFDDIREELIKKLDVPVVSLNDVVYEIN